MKFIYFILLLASISACKKIDLDQLAFPRVELDAYVFGESEIPEKYNIDESMIHLIPVTSVDKATGTEYTIYTVYLGDLNTIATDTVIVYSHGQAENMDYYWGRAQLLANLKSKNQYGILMMDYRGHGMSEGIPTEIGLTEDVEACVDWLVSNGVQEENTFFYGFSLGVIPTLDLIANKTDFTPSKVIIESPLASVENLTHNSTLINVSPSFVVTLTFNNAETMKSVKIPLCWLHGREDDYIELSNGQLVYDNHSGAYKEPHIIDNAGHGNIPDVMTYETYLDCIATFIQK
jgi:pimeloyl-ACP methyl ester carboxylesterase